MLPPIDPKSHIMLDLETTGHPRNNNPAIIEIGAIHFDKTTGKELDRFSTIVNLNSNKRYDLIIDGDTMRWLQNHIPKTLEASETSKMMLPDALQALSDWVKDCRAQISQLSYDIPGSRHLAGKVQTMIWSNGAMADGRWIATAYRACNLEPSWMFYNYACARTIARHCVSVTGRDIKRTETQYSIGQASSTLLWKTADIKSTG